MSTKDDFIAVMGAFFAELDHPPTAADVRMFVEGLTVEQRTAFLIASLVEAIAGLRPPHHGVQA